MNSNHKSFVPSPYVSTINLDIVLFFSVFSEFDHFSIFSEFDYISQYDVLFESMQFLFKKKKKNFNFETKVDIYLFLILNSGLICRLLN